MKRDALVALGAFGTATLFAGCYGSTKNFPRPAPTATAFATATAVPTATASGVRTPAPSATPVQTPSAAPTSTPSQGPTGSPAPTPTPSPSATPTAQPQVVHIGFELTEHTDPTFGPVWYYSPTLDNLANVIHVAAGSQARVSRRRERSAPHRRRLRQQRLPAEQRQSESVQSIRNGHRRLANVVDGDLEPWADVASVYRRALRVSIILDAASIIPFRRARPTNPWATSSSPNNE